ncbi:amidohydrolase [Microbacterium gorillae]|uniref:amidohydrolase n=1 Tax=Microbacterium gorillae TaxID=1231063 RepID=UPI001E410AC6|nr:amidohydrolase family protein [Microbacterium gorillae]
MALGARPTMVRNVRISGPTAELLATDEPVDLCLSGGRIVDIAPHGALRAGGESIDGDGLWAIPGLWDHHVHLTPWALRATRTFLGGAQNAREAAAVIARVAPDADGIRVGMGFRDALWPDEPTLAILDAATGDVPTYLVNADLHSVWLNSAALRREGRAGGDGSGMLREADAFELSARLDALVADRADALVAEAADAAAARGVVGVVDLDFAWNADSWRRRVADGFDALRIAFGVYPDDLGRARSAGLRTGESLGGEGLVRVGPLKIIADGSLGTRTAACSHPYPDTGRGVLAYDAQSLTMLVAEGVAAGFDIAVHGIGDRAVTLALDAFARTGASGSVEHAQLVDRVDLARFAHLGVTASVQPAHALDDRELVGAEWGAQTGLAYPLRTLHAAGANIVFGSDAPVAALDPWGAMADAVGRRRGDEDVWRGEERLDVATALAASTALGTAHRTELAPGSVADVAFCTADPYAADADGLRAMSVGLTLLAGRVTHLG